MIRIGETGCGEYGNSLYHLHNFSVNIKLFQNKTCIRNIEGPMLVVIQSVWLTQVVLGECLREGFKEVERGDFGNFLGLRKTAWETGPRRKVCTCPSLSRGAGRKGCLGTGCSEALP